MFRNPGQRNRQLSKRSRSGQIKSGDRIDKQTNGKFFVLSKSIK